MDLLCPACGCDLRNITAIRIQPCRHELCLPCFRSGWCATEDGCPVCGKEIGSHETWTIMLSLVDSERMYYNCKPGERIECKLINSKQQQQQQQDCSVWEMSHPLDVLGRWLRPITDQFDGIEPISGGMKWVWSSDRSPALTWRCCACARIVPVDCACRYGTNGQGWITKMLNDDEMNCAKLAGAPDPAFRCADCSKGKQ